MGIVVDWSDAEMGGLSSALQKSHSCTKRMSSTLDSVLAESQG